MRIERNYEFTVDENVSPKQRIDAFLSSQIEGLSRSALTNSMSQMTINGRIAKKSDTVSHGDVVSLSYVADVFEKVEPQNIPLDILYEDSSMLVINKKQGMVVHPGAGNVDGTIVNALAYRYGQDFIDAMADECDVSRPGIVHRLDKDTSGVMVIALTAKAHAALSAQFQNREIEKYYLAFCDGIFSSHEDYIECFMARDKNNRKLFVPVKERKYIIQGGLSPKRTQEIMDEVYKDPKYRIGGSSDRLTEGKYSKSHYEVIKQLPQAALVKVRIFTGRTHQIRVHMKSIGHPVVGDVLYNNKISHFPDWPLMLHSSVLEICHPDTGKLMHFEAPIPERFVTFEDFLKKD